jgi:ATP-dependent Clp endopeptidase proteolytic subunit ClpP
MTAPENAKDWFRIENNADDADATDIYVYESIGGWFGMWADDFIRELKDVATSKINLRLNSPGGSVFDGIAIANALRSHPANVTVYVDSLAASIASVIALAGDRVVMMPQSQFMVHNASGVCQGDATEMTRMADMLDKQSLNIAKAYAQHTGGSLTDWQNYMAEETWFSAEEAVAVGLADEVLPMKSTEPATATASAAPLADVMNRTWDLSMYRYAGRDNAPDPVASAAEHRISAGFANGITNQTEEPVPVTEAAVETVEEEPTSASNTIANMTRDELVSLISDVVKAAMAPPDEEEPTDTFPPDEEEPEDAATEEPEDTASEPEDAKKKLPAFLQPKKGDEDEEDPDDATTEEPQDVWSSLVARLTAPSPSADDVFNSLKEAW